MEDTIQAKLKEYQEHIETLKGIDELEVYNWMMGLGAKLNDDALSEDKRTIDNKIKQCQFDLYVDREDNKFKAWSNGMIAAGYAYILLDIFNSLPAEESKKITEEHFQTIKLDEMLTMNRKTGFYEMVGLMINKVKEVK
jgi:sulfur transfer protein SufE|tara:strand:+ start:195 stop:611 length:417 start_codon:yes stop_codon:yes gene_type:complete